MLTIRRMIPADIPLGMHLKTQAGWNQLEGDWLRTLGLAPEGCFVAEWDAAPVATTATTIFDEVAWISMVLVEQAHRGRGIGTALMEYALDYLEDREVRSIRLDATALGEPVYRKLGFEPDFDLVRLSGTVPNVVPGNQDSGHAADKPAHAFTLDKEVTRTRRGLLLVSLAGEPRSDFFTRWKNDTLTAYLMSRPGANARQLGPCIVREPGVPTELLDEFAWSHSGDPLFVDVPLDNAEALRFFEGWSLSEQRRFVRMTRGDRIDEDPLRIVATFGPEKG